MNVSQRYHGQTRAFARLLGPFFAIVALVVIFRTPDMDAILTEFTASHVWPWVTGTIGTLGGLAIVAFHQHWRGVAPAIISAFGWILLARGVILLGFPDLFTSVADHTIGTVGTWQVVYVVVLVLGLYLTYVGWGPRRHMQALEEPPTATDLPRAA